MTVAAPVPRGADLRALTAAALLLALTACQAAPDPGPPGAGSGAGDELSGSLVVFAAASLADAFAEIAEDFEQAHQGIDVTLNLGGSSALAQQVLAGAPADVFAAASATTMATVTGVGAAQEPQVFARNTLQIAVPSGNPGEVTGLADLADEDLEIALCAEQVPCGAAARAVLAAAGVTAAPDTLESDVRAALSKVRLGEVDAALVYRTDVLAAGDEVEGVAFPEAEAAANDYPIATLSDARQPQAAAAFQAWVLSEKGQRVLDRAGFDRR